MDLVRTGTIVGGRYRAVRIAWPSAVGPVWQAKDTVLDRDVLLFTLSPDVAADSHAVEALLAAAARTATITDAHVAQVYDCSADPPYLVSEAPAGGRLAERIADRPLPIAEAARVVVGVAAGIRAIHHAGAAHGAISPAWVALDEEGRTKILGTGLSDVSAVVAAVRGRPTDPPFQPSGYPEAAGDPKSTDVRSLAALAHHLISGKPPGSPTSSKTRIPAPLSQAIERGVRGEADLREIVTAFRHHATAATPAEREPGFLRTEGRWLAGVVLGVGVAIGIAIASVALVKSTTSNNTAPKATPSASVAPLAVQAVHDFDPFGQDRSEHPQQAERAADNKDASAWFTVGYATPQLGGKKGVGLVFDLGRPARVASLRIATPLNGWSGEVRVADIDAGTLDAFRPVKTFTATTDTAVALEQAETARYWLIWITRLTDAGSGGQFPFQAAVAEVRFLPA